VKVAKWRLATGIAVLVLLALIGFALLPPYISNFQFQQYLNALVGDPASATVPVGQVKDRVVAKATSLGIRLAEQDVHVIRTDSEFKIEVLYLVRVDLTAYSVDLHFRPMAGGA
jgi:hypothetical protein